MIVDVRLTVADVEHESPKLEGRSGDAENQRAGKRVALKHIKNQEMAFRFFGNF